MNELNKGKLKLLKAMDTVVTCINDEEAYMWWVNIVPDQATESDFRFIVEDDEEYEAAVRVFGQICKNFLETGIYIDGDLYETK